MEQKLELEDRETRRRVYRCERTGNQAVFLVELDPGGRVPLHRHRDAVEMVEVLEGERIATIGGTRKLLRAGGEQEIVPVNTFFGILDPQEGTSDGRFRYRLTVVYAGPVIEAPRLGVRRIVAVTRGPGGRIESVRYDDGCVRTVEEAVEDADRGLLEGVHTVHPLRGRPYLRVHHAVRGGVSLEDLPAVEDVAWRGGKPGRPRT